MRVKSQRSVMFELRGVFWLVVTAILSFSSVPVSWAVWVLVSGFLVSSFIPLLLSPSWFRNPRTSFVLFFLDVAGLTIMLFGTSWMSSSSSLLFYYLALFAATMAGSARRGVVVTVVVAGLYVAFRLSHGGTLLGNTQALLNIPLFFATALICGHLSEEVHADKLQFQKQAEDEVQASEERYRLLFQSNPQPMWVYDLETLTFLDVNLSAMEKYGFSREEFLHIDLKAISLPEEGGSLSSAAPRAAKGRKRPGIRKQRKKDGTTFDAEITAHPLIFAGRRAELVLANDISERRSAEETIKATNRTLQTLIQASPLAIISLDTDGLVRSWNAAAERMFGWTELEVLGRPVPHVSADQEDKFSQMLACLLRGEVLTAVGVQRRRKNGSTIDVSVSAAPLHDTQGQIYGVVALVADVSERKQLEEQFRQAQKMEAVGRLAGGVAHDFNNLLTVINGYSQLLADRHDPGDPLHGYAEEIQKAGDRAASLTRQLLAFSRKQVLTPQVLELNAVVANMEKMLRRLIGEDIQLEIARGVQLACVKADPGQLEQILMNLAVNSRDAMPQGGRIIIETANVDLDEAYARQHVEVTPGPYVMLAVSDSGVGMDAETQARIFEPFFTTKEQGKGTGLGLATVYGIVKQSGGHISVYSQPAHGTTFKIYLPALSPQGQAKEQPDARLVSLPRGTETILLVEDEDGVRSLATTILESLGYKVLAADDPEKAVQISERHAGPIALLLTDVVMPKMNGPQLTQHLAFSRPEMKVLFMSGYTDMAANQSGVIDSDTPFLQKPFTREALGKKVRGLLDAATKLTG